MPSKNKISFYPNNEDKKLLELAIKKYKISTSEFVREIVHSWLFNNKLILEKKR